MALALTMLEQQMEELKELPARVERVESQILQLRSEVKVECSAIRDEMRIRRDVVSRLDRLLELPRPGDSPT
jgi:predicted RNase H-like nuclease (RuvC/YqgF family)